MLLDGINRKVRKPWKFNGEFFSNNQRRGLALTILEHLITNYEQIQEQLIFDVFNGLISPISASMDGVSLAKITSGAPATFAKSRRFKELSSTVEIIEEVRDIRTIHKTKSAEFKNVAVAFIDNIDLKELLDSSIKNEENRIRYVACSRAKDTLSLIVPEITGDQKTRLESLGVNLII